MIVEVTEWPNAARPWQKGCYLRWMVNMHEDRPEVFLMTPIGSDIHIKSGIAFCILFTFSANLPVDEREGV